MAEQDTKQPEYESAAEHPQADAARSGAEDAAAGEPATRAAASGADPIATNGEAEGQTLEELVAQLQEDVAAAQDAALRAQADAQNFKRRAEQDVERARKFALESFCKELLPVVDNLERALESTRGDGEALKPIAEGVELTLKSLLDALRKFNVEQVDPQGEPFDPQLHQAMSIVENSEVEPNTVIAVMQKGYTLNARLVRPAMVLVSKAPNA